ncbi:bifunctional glutamate N-acetyltransferase/amino-acid acetyltransferase ArgJ [Larsenimonas suaedae]|uniref:Arginine biosynthesis bifunctional protein ArgJ n=1 Tax=Larsenimonas suaedae TaxID=1851019 RepID=A0ABU1GW30_9GAMM|nr:bifunctional glutamate N-acetyltransferase/amino-acid acetyltransferase ArgJ [Larsenimonas suaedae]MCM2971048.1 bifunctional glutamate N-acetyltransferase/amino-acid acetyltransferase ArgJ [Larsenimonas suaedae]MDR5895757.1 bifunctional glutamate N-acetyltransferase/amino-acid acetyltransferase ArgJ [Larsenimonas suaedae]
MAVGSAHFPEMPVIDGIKLGVAQAGIKKPSHDDLVVIELDEGTRVAGVFTQNAFCAAPVHVAKRHLADDAPRWLVINTGNANAGTGDQGLRDARACCEALAEAAGGVVGNVLPFSTGVIGEPLPVERIKAALPAALDALGNNHWAAAGRGILTTDTRPKGATRTLEINGETVHINGIAKGSGMICPNMATMLAFVGTNASIDHDTLQSLLSDTTTRSFNRITVDSDTSTNDACMLMATQRTQMLDAEGLTRFKDALQAVMTELAQAIIRDGEGATKFITIDVEEAANEGEALAVAFSIAHSPLVKTALYASDANWGRFLMAVGKAPVADLDVDKVVLELNGVRLAEHGGRAAGYSEEAGSQAVAEQEITVRVALGRGAHAERVWTSDLSHDYVSINADYRS